MPSFAPWIFRSTLSLSIAGALASALPCAAAEPATKTAAIDYAVLLTGQNDAAAGPATAPDLSAAADPAPASSRTAAPAPAASTPAAATSGDPTIGHDGQPLTPELQELGAQIRRTLALYEPKHLNARDNTCWEVMHGLIAFGPRTEIFRDGPGGQTVNAMGWLCWGARCQGAPLIVLDNGRPHGLYGVGLEGHDGQYLAMLAQWRVRPESPMHIGGQDFTVADMIEDEKETCQSGTELTFKLIALAHYLPSDAQWTSRNGEHWDIPKLLKAEIEAPIHGATCGGSHRLLGIANAVKERTRQGLPIDGQYARAAKYISDYQRYTVGTLQNPDGSFSTEWFNYPADRPGDIDRKLQTTGHMLEFLVWSLPTNQLRDPRVVKTVDFLSDLLLANPDKAWSVGPLGHGLHALMIYHERLYNQPPLPPQPLTAGEPIKTKPTAEISSRKPADRMPPELAPADEDGDGSLTMSQLQKAVARPRPLSPEDGAAAPRRSPATPASPAPASQPGYASSASDAAHNSAAAGTLATPALPSATAANSVDQAATPEELTAQKKMADASDGCTDAVPALAARVSTLRLAMRDIISAIATPPAGSTAAPIPPAADAIPTLKEPTFPTDAPFDRPSASKVGP